MRKNELSVGLVVAVNGAGYRAELGDQNARRGIVLDARNVWTGHFRNYRDGGGSRWNPGRYPVAVEEKEYVEVGGDQAYRATGQWIWVPRLFSGRDILGLWSDHKPIAEAYRQRQEARQAEVDANIDLAKSTNDRLERLGLGRPIKETGHEKALIPLATLAKIVERIPEHEYVS